MTDVFDRRGELRRLVNGFQVSQGLSVLTQMGIPDLLAGGPRTSDELAQEVGADPSSLYRLLRALATVGVLEESTGQLFSLTELGDGLRADAEASLAGWAAYVGSEAYWAAWGQLAYSVRSGGNAFRHVHGTDVWTFRSTRPDESARFNGAMASLSGQQSVAPATYDYSAFATIADIGGGTGSFLAHILSVTPSARGVLLDLPNVVAEAPAVLAAAGVAERCDIVGGSFFDSVPAGCDAYVLKAVVHDWNDDDAVRILTTVRAAMPDDGRVVLVERVLAGPNDGRQAKWSDLNMLVVAGGRERTQAEFDDLFRRAGLRPTKTTPGPLYAHIEAALG